jgi:hypothetical protein
MRKWLLIAVSLSSGAALWQLPPSAAAADSGTRFKVSRKFLYPTEFTAGKAYSPGVLVGDTLYIAGQIDKDPTGAQPVGMAAQTRLAMTPGQRSWCRRHGPRGPRASESTLLG